MKRLKGSAGSLCVFIVFVSFAIIPLLAFFIDSLRLEITANEVMNSVDMALADTYHALDKEILSKRGFVANQVRFKELFMNNIQEALRLDGALNPLENSILDGPLTINEIIFIDTFKKEERPFISVDFTLRFKPFAYFGIDLKEFNAVRKLSLPTS